MAIRIGSKRASLLVVGLLTTTLCGPASADNASGGSASVGGAPDRDASANDRLAQALFEEGRELMKAEQYASACRRLEESQRLGPGGGTLLNLAFCHEKEGRTATAWAEYHEALSQAKRDGRKDREQRARERLSTLVPPRVNLDLARVAPIAALELTVDGTLVPKAAWGLGLPVDPGRHVVVAIAPGRKPWKAELVALPGQNTHVSVPELESNRDEVSAGPASASVGSSSGVRAIGYVVGGLGLAGLAAGGIFGLRAGSRWADRNRHCPASQCDAEAVAAGTDAQRAATAEFRAWRGGTFLASKSAELIVSNDDEGGTPELRQSLTGARCGRAP